MDAAQSCGLDARTGSVTPGKDADLILLRANDLTVFPVTDPAATIVSAGHPGLADTVLVLAAWSNATGYSWTWTWRR
ncbi:amidohydrolase family protein [Streptomyces sp. NPDC001795]|uniref:amidohydrolase family protein n=1 Tax=unclassified Streptomyces TaxID=2593676 RepID=UPI003324686B